MSDSYDDQDVLIRPNLLAPLDAYWDSGYSWLVGEESGAPPPSGNWFLLQAKNELQGIRGMNG